MQAISFNDESSVDRVRVCLHKKEQPVDMIEWTEVKYDGYLLETIQENTHMNHVWQIPVSWSFFYMSNEKTPCLFRVII